MPIVDAVEAAAETFVGVGRSLAGSSLDLVVGLAGPFGGILMDAADRLMPGDGQTYAFGGPGRADLTIAQGTQRGSCEGLRLTIEIHPPPFGSQEDLVLTINALGGQGSHPLVCANALTDVFRSREVSGSEQHGWVGRSRQIDANVDMTISAPDGQGRRAVWVHHTTYPQGIADVIEVRGIVSDLA